MLITIAVATPFANGATVSLPDKGVRLEIDDAGALKELTVGTKVFSGSSASSGLFVRDGLKGELAPVGVGIGKGRVSDLDKAGLRITAQIEAQADRILVSGAVEDLRGKDDRGVDVVFRLPFAPAKWWGSISETIAPETTPTAAAKRRERDDLPEGAGVLERIEYGGLAQDFMPIQCVTSPDEKAGLAVAIAPDFPCRFRFAHLREQGCLELQFLLGLSQAGSGEFKGRAPFQFFIYPADGHWGFRDALRRYHAMFAKVFARRTQASGLWLVSMPSLKNVTDPENYAFWQATRLSETPMALKLGLLPCPYTIVGQRELGYLKQPISTYAEVLGVLEKKPESTRKSRYTWEVVKPLVESSGLRDPEGKLIFRLRETDWAGNGVSFPVNPSPFLPVSEAQPTVASHTFAEVASALGQYPQIAGFFVDSLGMWGSYENYRPDHFAAARAPLTHDTRGRVCLPNWMPHVDYLRELHRRIGERLVFANGVRLGRAFCAMELDVLGLELSLRDLESRTQMDFVRAMAGAKPAVCLLNYPETGLTREQAEQYVPRLVALGLAPEMRRVPWPKYKERDADLYKLFMPICRKLDLAGWQPVAHAAVKGEGVWIERFGTKAPDLYFTVYNSTSKPVEAVVTLDLHAIGVPANAQFQEIVGQRAPVDLSQPIVLPPHGLRVLQLAN